jgi:hypothetical protein
MIRDSTAKMGNEPIDQNPFRFREPFGHRLQRLASAKHSGCCLQTQLSPGPDHSGCSLHVKRDRVHSVFYQRPQKFIVGLHPWLRGKATRCGHLAFRLLIEMLNRIAVFRTDSGDRPVFFAIASKSIVLAISTSARSDAKDRPRCGNLEAINLGATQWACAVSAAW